MDLDEQPPAEAPNAPERQRQPEGPSAQAGGSNGIKDNGSAHKMKKLPQGAQIRRRGMPQRPVSNQSTKVIFVSTKTSFMSVVRRVVKALDAGLTAPRAPTTKGLPLTARIAALQVQQHGRPAASDEIVKDKFEVRVMGTGRAIEKTVNIASWFLRRPEYAVRVRTRTVGTVDDIIVTAEDGDAVMSGAEEPPAAPVTTEEARIRMVSCLELRVRLR